MHHPRTANSRLVLIATSGLATLVLLGLVLVPREASAQASMPPAAADDGAMEIPHPFFTHEGLPEDFGTYSLRVAGLATRADGKTEGDFAFHLEMSLTKRIGLHIRNDSVRNSPKTEAMFQFAAITNKEGTSGFAPIIEFEVPTKAGASRVSTLVGFTTKFTASRLAFNQVVHYDPREDAVDASAALVVRATDRVFPVVEILAAGARGAPTIVNMLVGLKLRVRPWVALGFAFELPLSNAKDFSSRGVFEPELMWGQPR